MRKKLMIMGLVFVVVAVATVGFLVLGKERGVEKGVEETAATETPAVAEVPRETRIKVAAMGDMLPHESVVKNAWNGEKYDFGRYFEDIRGSYAGAEVVFCNQEALSGGEQFGLSYYPAFNAPKEFAEGLSTGAGCNLIGLANNHMGDKNVEAIAATLDKWQELPALAVAGANRNAEEQKTVKYFEVKGVKFAFLAFADYNNRKATPSYAVNLYHDAALFEEMLKEARANAEVVMVSMHWGTEDTAVLTADQKQQVAKLAAAGADVVIGTGPHVLQKTEWVKKADGKEMLVWYSIGNMLSSQLAENELTGCIAGFEIVKDEAGVRLEKPTCAPTFMSYEWTAAEKKKEDLLKRHDLRLRLLSACSDEDMKAMHFGDSVAERLKYVKDTLGEAVEVID